MHQFLKLMEKNHMKILHASGLNITAYVINIFKSMMY